MTDDVLISVEGVVGRLTLNRPKAIHALTHAMCKAMTEALIAWQSDPAIGIVLLDHKEGRGFCAGGDVVALAESAKGDGEAARAFWFDEYRLNHLLFGYPKPTIAFVDGIVMGGGVGIADPCRYRIATENTVFAMPETGIGLFPDVGGGWFLSRLPGRIGQFIALTGARLRGSDCVALGICSHYIGSPLLSEVKSAIVANADQCESILAAAAVQTAESPMLRRRGDIDRLFASDRLEDILTALLIDGSDWAREQEAIIRKKSPTSSKVALRQLAEGAQLESFTDEMIREYAIASRIVALPDFPEGVRALLVDKDNMPNWFPPTPETVSDAQIESIFHPLPADEEWTPLPQDTRHVA